MAALRFAGSTACSATRRSAALPAFFRLSPAPPVADTARLTRGGMEKPKPFAHASMSMSSTLKMCFREWEA
jgi:hypothetical protein